MGANPPGPGATALEGVAAALDASRRIGVGLGQVSAEDLGDALTRVEALTAVLRDLGRTLESLHQVKTRVIE